MFASDLLLKPYEMNECSGTIAVHSLTTFEDILKTLNVSSVTHTITEEEGVYKVRELEPVTFIKWKSTLSADFKCMRSCNFPKLSGLPMHLLHPSIVVSPLIDEQYYYGVSKSASQLGEGRGKVNSICGIEKEMDFLDSVIRFFASHNGFGYLRFSGIYESEDGIGFIPSAIGLDSGILEFTSMMYFIDAFFAKKSIEYSKKSMELSKRLKSYTECRTWELLLSRLPKLPEPEVAQVDRVALTNMLCGIQNHPEFFPAIVQILATEMELIGDEVDLDVSKMSETLCQKLFEFLMTPEVEPLISLNILISSVVYAEVETVVVTKVSMETYFEMVELEEVEEEQTAPRFAPKRSRSDEHDQNDRFSKLVKHLDNNEIMALLCSIRCTMEKRKAIILALYESGDIDEQLIVWLVLAASGNTEWLDFMSSIYPDDTEDILNKLPILC